MNIYQSDFLTITNQGDTLIQSWTEKSLNPDDFKCELYNYMKIFYEIKPKNLVFDTRNCSLVIPEGLDGWIGENVLIPIFKKGIRSLVCTIPDDIAVHFSIVTSLEKAKSILQTTYFSDFNEARSFSKHRIETSVKNQNPTFECQLNKLTDSIDINLNIASNDLPGFLTSMKQIETDNQFIREHKKHYNSLTVRENQIFKLIVYGRTNGQIAEELFIEESSVKTHRKNIKHKLKIATHFDVYQYARCFQIA